MRFDSVKQKDIYAEFDMRFRHITQMTIDRISIEDIELDMTSRHSMVAIIVGLQHLYINSRDTLKRILT